MVLRMSGQVVLAGRYRLDHQLGSGGMGTVWRGYDLRLHRAVAIKHATEHNSAPADARRRLRREAAALGALCEARIARVFDYLESGDDAYIVMELVDGESLSARLKREQRLSAADAARIAAHCAWALHAAHRSGVVHRDVKPSNIMLTADGSVKIVDFGIASTFRAVGALTQDMTMETLTAGVAGTAAYFAPECAQGEPGSPAADFYALGVVLYQMLAGYLPFHAHEALAMLLAHATATPDPLPADVPPALVALCMRLLAKNPADRPPSGALIASRLENADLSKRTTTATRATFASTTFIGAQPTRLRPVLKHRHAMLTSAPLAVLLTTATVLSLVAAQSATADGTTDRFHLGTPTYSSSAPASHPAGLLAQTSAPSAHVTTGSSHAAAATSTPSAPATSPSASPTDTATGSPSASASAATASPSSSSASQPADGSASPSAPATPITATPTSTSP